MASLLCQPLDSFSAPQRNYSLFCVFLTWLLFLPLKHSPGHDQFTPLSVLALPIVALFSLDYSTGFSLLSYIQEKKKKRSFFYPKISHSGGFSVSLLTSFVLQVRVHHPGQSEKNLGLKLSLRPRGNSACTFVSSAFLSYRLYLTQKGQPAHWMVSLTVGPASLHQSLLIYQEKASQTLPQAILN